MAGLSLSKLKDVGKQLDERTGGGLQLKCKDLITGDDGNDFRVAPPKANLNGLYFLEVITWWIGKKKYVSPATFGLPCPLEEEYQAAREIAGDRELQLLVDDTDKCKKVSEFHVPGWLLKCKFDDHGEHTEIKVDGKKARVLLATMGLLKSINKVATSRVVLNGTEDGFCDREKGFNLMILKTGKEKETRYNAVAWKYSTEMDEALCTDEAIPDVVELAKAEVKSADHLRSVMRNYLYGEELLPEAKYAFKDAKKKEAAEVSTSRARGASESVKKKEEPKTEVKKEATSSSRGGAGRGATAEVAKTTTRSLSQSLLEDDED